MDITDYLNFLSTSEILHNLFDDGDLSQLTEMSLLLIW